MTDSKSTPGPWRVSGVSMQTGNISVSMEEHRIVIAEVTNAASLGDMIAGAMKRGGGSFDQGDCHTQMANARLIAAAPDLLGCLKAMVAETVEYATINKLGDPEKQHNIKWARSIIAKAEGK